jgi:hypothetical protein
MKVLTNVTDATRGLSSLEVMSEATTVLQQKCNGNAKIMQWKCQNNAIEIPNGAIKLVRSN